MSASRLFVVTVCAALLFAPPARTDEPRSEEKVFALVPVSVLSASESAALLKKLGYEHVAPVPLFRAIVVWDTPKEVYDAKMWLRPL